jgi:hypothetical protein
MEGHCSRLEQMEDRISKLEKGICNMFNKIITENFPNLEKDSPIHV